jgi:hypothetical protein
MSEKKQLWVFYDAVAKIQSNPLSRDEAQSTILKIRPQSIERFYIWTQGWQNWQPLQTYLQSEQKVFVSTFTVSRSNEETVKAIAKELFEQTATHAHTKTSFPHEDTQTSTQTATQTQTETKGYSHINLREETISRFLKATDIDPDFSANFSADNLNLKESVKPKLDFSKILKKMDSRSPRLEFKIETLLISPRGKTFRTLSKNISLTGVLLEECMPFDFYDNVFDIIVISSINKDPARSRVKLNGKAVMSGGNYTQRVQFINQTPEQKANLQYLLEDYMESSKNMKTTKKTG